VLADYLAQRRTAPLRWPAAATRRIAAPLWQHLQDHLEAAADGIEPLAVDWSRPVGLLSPHIDYARGGAVYARVWQRAAQLAREAELVILLGVDHYGSDPFTLTRQHYATPYGVLPTDTALVDQLAAAIGPEAAFAGELRHRGEHSLELVAVWLHHMRGGAPVSPRADPHRLLLSLHAQRRHARAATRPSPAVLDVLRRAAAGKRTLVVASGDLAHVGAGLRRTRPRPCGPAPAGRRGRRVDRRDALRRRRRLLWRHQAGAGSQQRLRRCAHLPDHATARRASLANSGATPSAPRTTRRRRW
jgi:AmmeMemoRadiSam system protein B